MIISQGPWRDRALKLIQSLDDAIEYLTSRLKQADHNFLSLHAPFHGGSAKNASWSDSWEPFYALLLHTDAVFYINIVILYRNLNCAPTQHMWYCQVHSLVLNLRIAIDDYCQTTISLVRVQQEMDMQPCSSLVGIVYSFSATTDFGVQHPSAQPIPPIFIPDLTRLIIRCCQYPVSGGSYGDIYKCVYSGPDGDVEVRISITTLP